MNCWSSEVQYRVGLVNLRYILFLYEQMNVRTVNWSTNLSTGTEVA